MRSTQNIMKSGLIAVAAGLAAIIVSISARAQISAGLYFDSCATDSEITAVDRKAVETSALQLVRSLTLSDVKGVYESLSTAARQELTVDKLSALVTQQHAQFNVSKARIEHSYFISISGTVTTEITLGCTLLAGGNASKPEEEIYFRARPTSKQAYVIVDADRGNNSVAIISRLVPQADGWKVDTIDMAVIGIGQKTSTDLIDIAEGQRSKGHEFNAYLFYFVSHALTARGPHTKLGLESKLAGETASFPKPAQLQGDAPWSWKAADQSFTISAAQITSDAGKLYLQVLRKPDPKEDENAVDRQNRDLVAYIKAEFPEYRDAFAGLIIQAINPAGQLSHRIVDEN